MRSVPDSLLTTTPPRPGLLLPLQDPTPEQKLRALYGVTAVHAAFGDIELAKMTLRGECLLCSVAVALACGRCATRGQCQRPVAVPCPRPPPPRPRPPVTMLCRGRRVRTGL